MPNFSQINGLQTKAFPLSNEASEALQILKNKLTNATSQPTNENLPFTEETDASTS